MVSYSSINFVPNSLNSGFLMGVLRGEENFGGFTISDYDDIDRAATMSLPRTFINLT
jgi:beta-glucosidase-like glycosyl hydrolase